MKYGLIGRKLEHSFSSGYFHNKFRTEGILASYNNIEIETIDQIVEVFKNGHNGFNVTIPYKTAILPYLDLLDNAASEIGAVNCIKITNGVKIGHNTDWIGFKKSCIDFIRNNHSINEALILGDGGAAKAIIYALKDIGINFKIASRKPFHLDINNLTEEDIQGVQLIINTTPIGMYPDIDSCLPLPYHFLTERHYLYDLIYNPIETKFLKNGKMYRAHVKNGHEMLILQAEESWKIWNDITN